MSQILTNLEIRNIKNSNSTPEKNGNLYVSGKIISGATTTAGSIKSYTGVTASFSLTAADIISYRVIKVAYSAGITVSFPTATLLLQGLPYNTAVGDIFEITIVTTPTGAVAFDLAAGVGGAVVGKVTSSGTVAGTFTVKVMITGDLTSPAYELYIL